MSLAPNTIANTTAAASLDLYKALAVAENLARRAGALLMLNAQRPRNVTYKGAINLVTETDKQSEALIVAGLLEHYPEHHIVGEEGGGMGAPRESAPYRWYIDPLDGTTNFVHGIPVFSVSIAVAGPDDVPLVGVVFDPNRNDCFKAVRGQGATLNGQPLQVSDVPDLTHSVLVTGFPYDRWTNPDNNIDRMAAFLMRVQGVARTGSAALNLCYVGAARFDGYWEMRINPWDVMAGLLCITEAGGMVTNFSGTQEGAYMGRDVVATNGLIHQAMLDVIRLKDAAPRP